MDDDAPGRKKKSLAHGPTVNAVKRAKYEAKQARRQQQDSCPSEAHRRASAWFDGRERYAAFISVDDVRDIKKSTDGKDITSDAKGGESRLRRIKEISDWIAPFFDLKQMPSVSSDIKERLFIAEGTEAVRMLIQKCETPLSVAPPPNDTTPPVRLISILCKPATFFDSPSFILGDIEKRHIINGNAPLFKIIVGSEEALSEIASFPVARGAMACGVVPDYMKRNGCAWLKSLVDSSKSTTAAVPATINTAQEQEPMRRILALDAISNAANMGSILRTAAAFSIDAIILSDDCCDAWYRQSVRVSLGHVVTVPTLRVADLLESGLTNDDRKVNGLTGLLRWLREQNIQCFAAVAHDDRDKTSYPPLVALENESFHRSWCVVLGNEGHGIRDEVIRICDKRINISIASGVDSLSLPIAAGILMHGLSSRSS
jgi:tRNA G18 (ribose-2'-O)-methylase SpoU